MYCKLHHFTEATCINKSLHSIGLFTVHWFGCIKIGHQTIKLITYTKAMRIISKGSKKFRELLLESKLILIHRQKQLVI